MKREPIIKEIMDDLRYTGSYRNSKDNSVPFQGNSSSSHSYKSYPIQSHGGKMPNPSHDGIHKFVHSKLEAE